MCISIPAIMLSGMNIKSFSLIPAPPLTVAAMASSGKFYLAQKKTTTLHL
jgi:hypothetical protein